MHLASRPSWFFGPFAGPQQKAVSGTSLNQVGYRPQTGHLPTAFWYMVGRAMGYLRFLP
jgi:hypothetical protein